MLNSKALPERCIGRTGADCFSSHKDLTVIMVPFERYSCFPKAVDDLYKVLDVPFNLIVVEGNAPDSVRHALEKRQKKYKNITILYSERHLSTGAAINLAVPHLNTPFAFIMDDDMRLTPQCMSKLLQKAREIKSGIICPQNYVLPQPTENTWSREGQESHTCFLISAEALQKIGKLDEDMTPCTAAIDIRMAADSAGVLITSETSTHVGCDTENLIMPMDSELHSFQWNSQRVTRSIENLAQKWGVFLHAKDYTGWVAKKERALRESKSTMFFLTWIGSKLKGIAPVKAVAAPAMYPSKAA